MKKNTQIWLVVGVVVVLVVGAIWWANSSTITATNDDNVVATSTADQWTAFKKEFECEVVKVPATTTVISFSNEGATTTADAQTVFTCRKNGTNALVVY